MNPVVSILNVFPESLASRLERGTLGATILRPLVNALLPNEPTPIVVRSGMARGVRLLIKPRTEKYYWTGVHEQEVQRRIVRLLRPGGCFWDIGSHIGFFTFIAARLVGALGEVHAFEPMPENRERLRASVRLNEASNVVVHDCAISNQTGSATLFAHNASLMWTLVPERSEGSGIPVRCVTLDDCAKSLRLPDLIKIDAEGAEVDVLRGAQVLLGAHHVPLIVEFTAPVDVDAARFLLPFYRFEQIGPRHWVLAGLSGSESDL